MGHQLYNERLQTGDKYCLSCFHLLWCWYTDFPIKLNKVHRVGKVMDKTSSSRWGKCSLFSVKWHLFYRYWVTSYRYFTSQTSPDNTKISEDLLSLSNTELSDRQPKHAFGKNPFAFCLVFSKRMLLSYCRVSSGHWHGYWIMSHFCLETLLSSIFSVLWIIMWSYQFLASCRFWAEYSIFTPLNSFWWVYHKH